MFSVVQRVRQDIGVRRSSRSPKGRIRPLSLRQARRSTSTSYAASASGAHDWRSCQSCRRSRRRRARSHFCRNIRAALSQFAAVARSDTMPSRYPAPQRRHQSPGICERLGKQLSSSHMDLVTRLRPLLWVWTLARATATTRREALRQAVRRSARAVLGSGCRAYFAGV